MFRIIVCLTLIICTFAAPSAKELAELQFNGEISIVENIHEARKIYPGAQFSLLQRNEFTKGVLQYTLGNREAGDQIVAQGADGYQWSSPQNIQFKLQYPNGGNGARITYVNVLVDQTGNSGQGYVASGGIGQRNILLVIEAYNVLHFNYQASIYGKP